MNILTTSTGLRGLITTAIFGALASSLGAVSAANGLAPTSQTVKFADLNITGAPGAVVLYARIQAAAERVCSAYIFRSDLYQDRCVHEAIANAVTEVNRPALYAVYNAKNKTPLPNTLVSQSH